MRKKFHYSNASYFFEYTKLEEPYNDLSLKITFNDPLVDNLIRSCFNFVEGRDLETVQSIQNLSQSAKCHLGSGILPTKFFENFSNDS